MRIIDAHTHILPPEIIARREEYCQRDRCFGMLYASPRARLADAGELLASMDGAGVDMAVVFGIAFADLGLCRLCNDYVLDAARQHPLRLFPFALAAPYARDQAWREVRRCLEAGAAGIGELMPDGQGFALTDFELLDPLMALARAYKAPAMAHVNELVGHDYAGKGTQGPHQAYLCASHYPQNTLIFSHWGGGLPFYELMPEVRSVLSNVYYDTAASSYLYEDAIFQYVAGWAPAKILWGSDYPLLKQRPFLQRVTNLGLDPIALANVLGGNALAVLGVNREAT